MFNNELNVVSNVFVIGTKVNDIFFSAYNFSLHSHPTDAIIMGEFKLIIELGNSTTALPRSPRNA